MDRPLGLRPGDIVLIGALLLTALALFLLPFLSRQADTAQIVLAETGQIQTIPLNQNATYEVTSRGIHLTVQVEDGSVSVSASDCRDGICQATAPISRVGQSIICAPGGVVVRITGEEVLVDGVSG